MGAPDVFLVTPGLSRYARDEDSQRFLRWAECYLPTCSFRDAAAFYAEVGDSGVPDAVVAGLGLIDRVFLLAVLLGRRDVLNPWLYERCREVEAAPDGYLDLWAREHYKSTIITFAGCIQEILRDPEITIGIFSHNRPISKAFLRQIKIEFETNARLKRIYPDVLYQHPDRESPKWSEDDGIIVRRKTNPKEATVEAWGLVDGQPTSKHFKLLDYDDVVTKESVTNPDQIKKTTDAWEHSLNLGAHGGRRWHIGTRWHQADTWRAILDRGSAKPRIYPATDDGTETGKPVFLSPAVLAEKRRDMGPYTFAAQMLQNPTADKNQGFKEEWLEYWRPDRWTGMNRYILVDPASKKKKSSDYTTMAVIGLGADKKYRVIDWYRDRLNLTERTKLLFRLHKTYKPICVGYEEYGMQADIEHIRYVQEQDNYSFSIVALGGSMPKEDRIKRLVPVFEQGRMLLPIGLTHLDYEKRAYDPAEVFIREEYLDFPVPLHDDMIDGLSRIQDDDMQVSWPVAEVIEKQPEWAKRLMGAQRAAGGWQGR